MQYETLALHRLRSDSDGTFGTLLRRTNTEWGQLAVTCELPWKDNLPGRSCIPPGRYLCKPHIGPRFQNVWELVEVPGRTAILIHNGNTIDDTDGCILVGSRYGLLMGMPAVLDSLHALARLRRELPDFFALEIDATALNKEPTA